MRLAGRETRIPGGEVEGADVLRTAARHGGGDGAKLFRGLRQVSGTGGEGIVRWRLWSQPSECRSARAIEVGTDLLNRGKRHRPLVSSRARRCHRCPSPGATQIGEKGALTSPFDRTTFLSARPQLPGTNYSRSRRRHRSISELRAASTATVSLGTTSPREGRRGGLRCTSTNLGTADRSSSATRAERPRRRPGVESSYTGRIATAKSIASFAPAGGARVEGRAAATATRPGLDAFAAAFKPQRSSWRGDGIHVETSCATRGKLDGS